MGLQGVIINLGSEFNSANLHSFYYPYYALNYLFIILSLTSAKSYHEMGPSPKGASFVRTSATGTPFRLLARCTTDIAFMVWLLFLLIFLNALFVII